MAHFQLPGNESQYFCVINSNHFWYLFLSQSNQTNHIKRSSKTQKNPFLAATTVGDQPTARKKRGFSKALIWQGGAEAPPKEA